MIAATGGEIARMGDTKARAPKMERQSVWQMKKRGCAGVKSTAPSCGYDQRTLESLKKAGWHLYDGEKKIW